MKEDDREVLTANIENWVRVLESAGFKTRNEPFVGSLLGQRDVQLQQVFRDVSYDQCTALKDIQKQLTTAECIGWRVVSLREDGSAQCITAEINRIVSCLRQLHRFMGGKFVASKALTPLVMLEIQNVLDSCMTTLAELKRTLEWLGANCLAERTRWIRKKPRVMMILQRLQLSQMSLNVIVTRLSRLTVEHQEDPFRPPQTINYEILSKVSEASSNRPTEPPSSVDALCIPILAPVRPRVPANGRENPDLMGRTPRYCSHSRTLFPRFSSEFIPPILCEEHSTGGIKASEAAG